MTAVVGIFDNRTAAVAAEQLLEGAGFGDRTGITYVLPDDGPAPPRLKRRGESMLRAAVKWGILASLIIEVPSLIALLIVPMDLNVKILLAATVWKFGAAFGSWIGAMSAGEEGLDDEHAAEYEALLGAGYALIAVDVRTRHRPGIRGALLESGALSLRDVRGTFVLRRPPRQSGAAVAS
ncbi:MAG: hypothetical protein OXE50_03590 [Chloroflexi bacterium]|nr:hypothetical protein [Chloroflexota bacterium]